MNLIKASLKKELREAGWSSRGYLPHFDGRAQPQFITLHLADSMPAKVIERWQVELRRFDKEAEQAILRKRIERYLDQGYGECLLGDHRIATIVQDSLMKFDGDRYDLFAWVVMPNHSHFLFTRSEECELKEIMQSHKSFTAHRANKLLNRSGQFWMMDYFDRFIRNAKHFRNTVKYIENNPVKAGLCAKPSDWPYSSAWFREHSGSAFTGSAAVPAR
jgi:REP element-mobilizing transposase RayT